MNPRRQSSKETNYLLLRTSTNALARPPYSGSQATTGSLVLRRRMPALCKRQQLPIVLADQCPSSNINGPVAVSLRKKGGLYLDILCPAVLLVRLRAGHTPLHKANANQLDAKVDPKCPRCGEMPQTIEHCLHH